MKQHLCFKGKECRVEIETNIWLFSHITEKNTNTVQRARQFIHPFSVNWPLEYQIIINLNERERIKAVECSGQTEQDEKKLFAFRIGQWSGQIIQCGIYWRPGSRM